MTLLTVTLHWDVTDLLGGLPATGPVTLTLTPTAELTDSSGHTIVAQVPVTQTGFGSGVLAGIIANDSAGLLPANAGYTISVTYGSTVLVQKFSTPILHSNGADQFLSDLAPVASLAMSFQYLPLPSGAASAGAVPVATGNGEASTWTVPASAPVRHVPFRAASSIKTTFQTGHGWTTSGTGVGSSNLNDTSTFIRGTQSATVTTAGNGIQAALSLTGASAADLTGKMIRLTFKVDNITHLATLAFYVGTSAFGSNFLWNYFTSTPGSLNYIQSGEWVTVCLSWADIVGSAGYTISSAGAPSTKTGFTDMRLATYDDGAGTVTVHYQSVEIVPDTSVTFPNGLVSITFDDSFQNVYDNARPVMDTYGYAGSLCTIQDQIGQSGKLTLAELRSLQNFSGWEVAGHAATLTAHNAGYETLTAAQVTTELVTLKTWLVANGFTADTFAYPMGFFSATTDGVPVDQLVAQYFPAARTIISELNEVWPPPMPARMKAITGISSFSGGVPVSTLTAANGPLVRCAQQGAWLQLSLHQVVTSSVTAVTQLSQTDFSTLLAEINSLGMTVLPVGSVTRTYG